MRAIVFILWLSGCGGLAWNTTLPDHPQVRSAMLASVEPGRTTETRFLTQWGRPTQKIREGGQVAYVYRNMTDPPGYVFPQFGDSSAYVIVLFQYGVAVAAYSSDIEGCRGTFAPRPPGLHYPNPATVKPVNCGLPPGADAGRDLGLLSSLARRGAGSGGERGRVDPYGGASPLPGVPPDVYRSEDSGKYK